MLKGEIRYSKYEIKYSKYYTYKMVCLVFGSIIK